MMRNSLSGMMRKDKKLGSFIWLQIDLDDTEIYLKLSANPNVMNPSSPRHLLELVALCWGILSVALSSAERESRALTQTPKFWLHRAENSSCKITCNIPHVIHINSMFNRYAGANLIFFSHLWLFYKVWINILFVFFQRHFQTAIKKIVWAINGKLSHLVQLLNTHLLKLIQH